LSHQIIRVALALSLLEPVVALAQNTIENDKLRVELIGLKRWTIPMIQDSLAKYAPHESLLTHSCAAILRDKLKFADASVGYFPKGEMGLTKELVVVSLIEPQDSALIRYRAEFTDTLPQRKAWLDAWNFISKHSEAFQRAIQTSNFARIDQHSLKENTTLGEALPLYAFLKTHKSSADMRLALKTLKSDGNWQNRIVAVVILRSFPQNDETWWTLIETLRDPNGRVSVTAGQTLEGMGRFASRRVKWRPAGGTLRTLLDGTNLFTYNAVLNTLARTKVEHGMANSLLAGGGNMVLAKLSSSSPSDQSAALQFLRQISGKDWKPTSPQWKPWVSAAGTNRTQ
jgi:hypothetical protein